MSKITYYNPMHKCYVSISDLEQFIVICFNEDMRASHPAPTYFQSAKKAVAEFCRTQPRSQVQQVREELIDLLTSTRSAEDQLENALDRMWIRWNFSPYGPWLQSVVADLDSFLGITPPRQQPSRPVVPPTQRNTPPPPRHWAQGRTTPTRDTSDASGTQVAALVALVVGLLIIFVVVSSPMWTNQSRYISSAPSVAQPEPVLATNQSSPLPSTIRQLDYKTWEVELHNAETFNTGVRVSRYSVVEMQPLLHPMHDRSAYKWEVEVNNARYSSPDPYAGEPFVLNMDGRMESVGTAELKLRNNSPVSPVTITLTINSSLPSTPAEPPLTAAMPYASTETLQARDKQADCTKEAELSDGRMLGTEEIAQLAALRGTCESLGIKIAVRSAATIHGYGIGRVATNSEVNYRGSEKAPAMSAYIVLPDTLVKSNESITVDAMLRGSVLVEQVERLCGSERPSLRMDWNGAAVGRPAALDKTSKGYELVYQSPIASTFVEDECKAVWRRGIVSVYICNKKIKEQEVACEYGVQGYGTAVR